MFFAANKLYGLTFKERNDLPVYQPDVRVFEVFDADGKSLALFYADYFKRDNKNGGAWMDSFVDQSGLLGTQPVVFNVCNFTKPAPGQPALLSFDDVTTMFHEFGHALHGMFSNVKYPTPRRHQRAARLRRVPVAVQRALGDRADASSRTTRSTTRPARRCRRSWSTKIKKSRTFNQGFATTEYLAAALLDMAWHTLPDGAPPQDVDAFEAEALQQLRRRLPAGPAALPHDLLRAHLGRRLLGRLLRVPLERGARRTTPTAGSSSTAA